MHLKRQEAPNNWPIARKGTAYVVVPRQAPGESIPLLVIIRDILHLAKTRKEVEMSLRSGKIKVNGKATRDDRFCARLFDIIDIGDKRYAVGLSKNGKFRVEETHKARKLTKILMITGKKTLKNNKTQLHFNDGRGIISKDKYKTKDFVLFDLENSKIIKNIPLKKGQKIIVVKGKHSGEDGKLDSVENDKAIILINSSKINIPLAHISLIEDE
ncbi:MAG: hypothetical protein AABX65_00890 [Nanoarchaeota archaeon]